MSKSKIVGSVVPRPKKLSNLGGLIPSHHVKIENESKWPIVVLVKSSCRKRVLKTMGVNIGMNSVEFEASTDDGELDLDEQVQVIGAGREASFTISGDNAKITVARDNSRGKVSVVRDGKRINAGDTWRATTDGITDQILELETMEDFYERYASK